MDIKGTEWVMVATQEDLICPTVASLVWDITCTQDHIFLLVVVEIAVSKIRIITMPLFRPVLPEPAE